MRRTFLLLSCLVGALTAACGTALAAPAQLYGKSVVVDWSEERSQKVNGEDAVRNVLRNGQFSVYLSSAGKPFSRMSFWFAQGRRGNIRSGQRDEVGGAGAARKVTFSGNTMTIGLGMSGGARNILVTFDGGFNGCSANVLTGKESGATSIKAKSLVNGSDVEMLSVKTGAASCRVQNGNIFGG